MIGLDVRMWRHPGIGRYIRELVRRLGADKKTELTLIGYEADREALPPRAAFRAARSGIYSVAEQFEIPRKAAGLPLLHVPHFNIPVFYRGRLVVTIHDLIYLQDRDASRSVFGPAYAELLFAGLARSAAAVITVSESTRHDLLVRYPRIKPANVHVTYEAASDLFKKIEDRGVLAKTAARHSLEKPFVLFVGSLKPHKNLANLIKAVERARARGAPHELVVVGRADPRQEDLLQLVRSTPCVRYLGELSDEDLVSIYNLAELFVMPSFREGFGLPLVEAMACGTPAIASDSSSLPEVLGEAGSLFDPHRIDALAELFYNVLRDSQLRQKMSAAGLQRAKSFSWERTAAETLRVYEQVLR